MEKYFHILGIIGLLLAVYGVASAILYSNVIWYSYFVVGCTFLAVTIILATLISAFIHEVPNIFAGEWVYTIPYITFEILQINILVIISWVVLIAIPLITKRILE